MHESNWSFFAPGYWLDSAPSRNIKRFRAGHCLDARNVNSMAMATISLNYVRVGVFFVCL